MIPASRLTKVIARGVQEIEAAQRSDGGFTSYTRASLTALEQGEPHPTVFAAALILSALCSLGPSPRLDRVRRQAADFLLSQRIPSWTFNYWPRGSEEARQFPYPDDLDDTACALAALQEYDRGLVTPEALAGFVRGLTACESQAGGPYYTWIVPPTAGGAWRDIDVGVNSNIAYVLARQDIHLPNLEALAEAAIGAKRYTTPYYSPSPYPVVYFLARWYRGPLVDELRAYVLGRRDAAGWWGNPLDSALAISALINLTTDPIEVEPAVSRLLEVGPRGLWPARGLYIERYDQGAPYYSGAPALTTAFVLEAVARYQHVQAGVGRPKPKPPAAVQRNHAAERLYQAVLAQVRAGFEQLGPEVKGQAELALERLLAGNHGRQVVLVPYAWEAALKPSATAATSQQLAALGAASLYGWLSYTIYDDFLDGDGEPAQLSVANVALRNVTLLFAAIANTNAALVALVSEILGRIDAANTWEILHCRATLQGRTLILKIIPDYGDFERLAERSLGHALGALCLTVLRGHAVDGPAVQQCRAFFTHYLIARQLNDDLHDWEDDLSRGHINAVGAFLLQHSTYQTPQGIRQPLRRLLGRLKQQLWERDITIFCNHIFRHVEAARQALRDNPALSAVAELASWLDPFERAARQALQERGQAQAFMKAYRRRPRI